MSDNVFEQYQKYFDSVITRHKAACQLENRHQAEEQQPMEQQPTKPPMQQPPQPPQQPTVAPQPMPQQQQPPMQQPPMQQPPMQQPPMQQPPMQPSNPVFTQDVYRQMMPPPPSANYWPHRGGVQPMYPPVHRLNQQPLYRPSFPNCSICACVTPYMPCPPPQCPPPQYFTVQQPFTYYPRQSYEQQAASNPVPMTMAPTEQPEQQEEPIVVDLPLQPDGPAEVKELEVANSAEAAVPSDKKPVFCYPSSVKGFSGTIPCGPCGSCKATQPAKSTAPVQPAGEPLGQQPKRESWQQSKQEPEQQPKESWQQPKQEHGHQATPCPAGKDCTGWLVNGTKERLPLGAQEPFVVGPSMYQYYFDHPA